MEEKVKNDLSTQNKEDLPQKYEEALEKTLKRHLSDVLVKISHLEKNRMTLRQIEDLIQKQGDDQRKLLQRNISDEVKEGLKRHTPVMPRPPEKSKMTKNEKILLSVTALGLFLVGFGSAYWGGYVAMEPVRKLYTGQYLYGSLLLKAWPKLTDKEKRRLKDLF